ncbi:gamma-glutamyl hydrolase-like [Periplaneta americana]|uniref:gamma-glutamyl hydrolase-like n=1 Tax=Periplaneta americana TaxID=6978 RepID=UPI0037E97C58
MAVKTLFLCILLAAVKLFANVEADLNNRPIIGVLAEEFRQRHGHETKQSSYIAASYVKFLEGAGARVVPVMINETKDYYRHIVDKVNGILLPGGATYFNATDGYAEAGGELYHLAVEKNKQGDYFPIWGTCLGFELLTYLAANKVEHRTRCLSYNEASPLWFRGNISASRMFKNAPYDIIGILAKENVTANFHHFCLTMETMRRLNLTIDWQFMTFNEDSYGMEYISTLEHRSYPFYGVQFHPEKNMYEWKQGKIHPHFAEAVRVSQFFANFFVNEARKNNHKFDNEMEERKHLIYNYPLVYTGNLTVFEQCYVF